MGGRAFQLIANEDAGCQQDTLGHTHTRAPSILYGAVQCVALRGIYTVHVPNGTVSLLRTALTQPLHLAASVLPLPGHYRLLAATGGDECVTLSETKRPTSTHTHTRPIPVGLVCALRVQQRFVVVIWPAHSALVRLLVALSVATTDQTTDSRALPVSGWSILVRLLPCVFFSFLLCAHAFLLFVHVFLVRLVPVHRTNLALPYARSFTSSC